MKRIRGKVVKSRKKTLPHNYNTNAIKRQIKEGYGYMMDISSSYPLPKKEMPF